MEKIKKYAQIVKEVLTAHIEEGGIDAPEYELYLIADETNFNYLVCQNMWRKGTRIYGCYVHIRIKNEKVAVEYDGTNMAFADLLFEAGIPKQDIVLAFHSPDKRPYTDFGVF